MGNSSSVGSSNSVCCISLEDTTYMDENTIKKGHKQRDVANNLFTKEEKSALHTSFKTSHNAPNSISIENENSFSSISSKSSSKSTQQENKLKKLKKNRFRGNSNRNDITVDEMRNDCAECFKGMSEEERVGIGSYEEVVVDGADSYYYSAGTSRTRRRSRELPAFRNLADERRE